MNSQTTELPELTPEQRGIAWKIAQADELHQTLCDALSGWRYIRETHGDLYGVGWDRVESRLDAQIAASAYRIKRAALEHAQRVAPRTLSWKEIEAVAETDEITGDGICVFGEELLRKFCEVNGITSDAATPSAGEAEPRMAFCPACFVEVSAKEADQQTLDARRYRWLRDQWDRGTLEAVMLSKSSDGTSWVGGEVLDGRIDAALSKAGTPTQDQEKDK